MLPKSRTLVAFAVGLRPLPRALITLFTWLLFGEAKGRSLEQGSAGNRMRPAWVCTPDRGPGRELEMEGPAAEEIERRIRELKARWPAHSVPPSMWDELEELETELERLRDDHEGASTEEGESG